MWVFIATLFVTAPNWKQSRHLSAGECLGRQCHTHSMELHPYHGANKRNELLIHRTTGMNLQGIMFNEKKSFSKGYMIARM
jgi:hypothetical protein